MSIFLVNRTYTPTTVNDVLRASVSCLTSGLIWAGWVVTLQTVSCAVTDAMS